MPNYVLLSPNALLVAKSVPVNNAIPAVYELEGGAHRARHERDNTPAPTIEFGGRVCYAAWGSKNAATDSAEGYIGNLLTQKHYSPLEHSSYTFYLSGISRAASHEIVRHRHLSFSQKSQRYVLDREPFEISLHPSIEAEFGEEPEDFIEDTLYGFESSLTIYEALRDRGLTHKQASEAARQVLPNAAAVNIVVTGNARSWMEFISKRDSDSADKELQVIARQINEVLAQELPEVFGTEARKLWDENFSQGGTKSSEKF